MGESHERMGNIGPGYVIHMAKAISGRCGPHRRVPCMIHSAKGILGDQGLQFMEQRDT